MLVYRIVELVLWQTEHWERWLRDVDTSCQAMYQLRELPWQRRKIRPYWDYQTWLFLAPKKLPGQPPWFPFLFTLCRAQRRSQKISHSTAKWESPTALPASLTGWMGGVLQEWSQNSYCEGWTSMIGLEASFWTFQVSSYSLEGGTRYCLGVKALISWHVRAGVKCAFM